MNMRTVIPISRWPISRRPISHRQPPPTAVAFDRQELHQILRVYGFFVAAGTWRDYAIDSLKDCAVFSIYQRASEQPLYRIVKTPHMARKQGAYCVMSMRGQMLRRGQNLVNVLKIFDRQKLTLVQGGI